ncbi:MAG: hypothetical protein KGI26_03390 [Thaumarchaeota archaeon]|nr:hypothetical protein [Nitrososphaerota archaeon]
MAAGAVQTKETINVGLAIGAADASDVPEIHALSVDLPAYGYNVVTTIVGDETDTISALISGQIQVAGLAPFAPVILNAQGQNLVIFGVMQAAPDEYMVCANGITTMQQIIQTQALTAYATRIDQTYIMPAWWLLQNGYNQSSINWTSIHGAANRGAALLAGKVTCASTDTSSTITLLSQPNNAFHVVMSLGQMDPSLPFNVWVTTQSYLAGHQTELTNMMEAYLKALHWAQNKADYMAYAPTIVGTQVSATELSQAYDKLLGTGIWNPNAPWTSSIATSLAQQMYTFNLTSSAMPTNQFANFAIYNAAIQSVGQYTG